MVDWDSLVLAPLFGIFAEPIDYAPASGASSYRIAGVYDAQYHPIDPDTGVRLMSSAPMIGVRDTELALLGAPAPQQDDRMTVVRLGLMFVIREVQPDSHGHTRCLLNVAGSDPAWTLDT